MTIVIEFIASILSGIGFGMVFSIPTQMLLISGLNGGFGWVMYRIALDLTGGVFVSTVISAFVISSISEVLARKLRYPASIFIFPGIINLCPGEGIYNTMSYFVNNQSNEAIASLYRTIGVAGSIAFGVLLASSFSASLRSFMLRGEKRTNYLRRNK